jgi:hypothetical protein
MIRCQLSLLIAICLFREAIGETKLFPTLYVGEHEHGLFAVPSLVDEKTMMIR